MKAKMLSYTQVGMVLVVLEGLGPMVLRKSCRKYGGYFEGAKAS
jgi:uncharacterized protein YjeT (DUF2065 family)